MRSKLEMLKEKINELEYRKRLTLEQPPTVIDSDIQSIEQHLDYQRKIETTEMEIQKIKHEIKNTEMEHRSIQLMCLKLEDEHRTKRPS